MVRTRRELFPYLVAIAPFILAALLIVAGSVLGDASTAAHAFPLPQPAPVGP
jgi:hypothetical protein